MIAELLKPQKIYFTSKVSDDYSRLSGKAAVKNYVDSDRKYQSEDDEKYFETRQVIYNSLQSMALYGKYKAFKSLFKNIEQEEELKQDFELYNRAGDVYKAENDIEKAHQLYETAYEYAQNTDMKTFFEIEKNYLESCFQLNENIDTQLETLKNRNIPNSTVNYLELDSFKNLKNNDKEKAEEEILSAYHIAKNNDIVNDDLYYKAALIMASNSQFEQSSEICKNRLDRLKKENKTFTREFLNYLTRLGVNNTFLANESADYDRARNTLLNALEIEKTVQSPAVREEINYNLLKIDYVNPDKDTIFERSSEFIKNSDNKSHQKDICQKAANYALTLGEENLLTTEESKDLSKPYFNRLEEILLSENPDNKELSKLYVRLQEIYPELYSEYSDKLNNLDNNYDLPLKQMLANINYHLQNKDEETLQKNLNSIIQDSSIDEVRKGVATDFKLLLKVNKGIDFIKSTNELMDNVNRLYYIYNKDKSNNVLAQHIYDTYNRLSNIQYGAGRYYESTISSDKAEDVAKDLNLSKEELEKLKVYSTLRNYKAKYYNSAELKCLEFLQMQTGIDKNDARYVDVEKFISGKTEAQCKKIAATIETLGIINLKNKNYHDAIKYYKKAVELREKLSSKDIYLANDYAALARLAILGYEILSDRNLSSKNMHNQCLKILDEKYPNEQITQEEHAFHKKYYGFKWGSVGKFLPWRNESAIIDKFKCYNRELNICE